MPELGTPALVYAIAALIVPFIRQNTLRQVFLLAVPVRLALAQPGKPLHAALLPHLAPAELALHLLLQQHRRRVLRVGRDLHLRYHL